MRDFLCKVYDKLYRFLGYADMRLILGYESGGKGCARISFYKRVASPPISLSHRCPNPTCPGGGNLKATPGCCSSSPSRCVNCGENHTAVHRDCESRPVPPTLRRSNVAAEEVPPPPTGDEMDTAADVQDHSPPPSPTRSLQSAFEMATPRARRTTILPASVRPTQSTGALPPAEQPSPSPMSRTASGLAR